MHSTSSSAPKLPSSSVEGGISSETRSRISGTAAVLAALALVTFLIINVGGINGAIEDMFAVSVTNLSCSGIAIGAAAVINYLDEKKDSKCKSVAIVVALLSPIIILNALSVLGVTALQPPHILGWSSLGTIVGVGVIGCAMRPKRKLTPEEEIKYKAVQELQTAYKVKFKEGEREKIERLASRMRETHKNKAGANIDRTLAWIINFWEQRAYCAAVECASSSHWIEAAALDAQKAYEKAFQQMQRYKNQGGQYRDVAVPSATDFIESFTKAHGVVA